MTSQSRYRLRKKETKTIPNRTGKARPTLKYVTLMSI